jgi:hypothetical protein
VIPDVEEDAEEAEFGGPEVFAAAMGFVEDEDADDDDNADEDADEETVDGVDSD